MSARMVLTAGVCLVFCAHAEEWRAVREAATAALRQQNNHEARLVLERGLRENAGSMTGEERAVVAGMLAGVERNAGDYAAAETVLRTEICENTASAGTRATLIVYLADLLREQAREKEASAVLSEARGISGLSTDQKTGLMVEAAELDRDMGRLGESIEMWNLAASAHVARFEAAITGGLGETWYAAGNLARAEPLLRRSLELLREDPAAGNAQVATALSLMGRLYIDENKLALAGEAVDEAVAKDEMSLGPDHPQVAMLLELRADILSRRGEVGSARDELERARVIMSGHFGETSTAMAGVYAELGDVETRAGRAAAAVYEYGRAMELLRRDGGDAARFGSGLLARYAAALKAAHRNEEAKDVSRMAVAQSFREK